MRGVRNTYAPWAVGFYLVTAVCAGACGWLAWARPDTTGVALMVMLLAMAAIGFFLAAVMATVAAAWEHVQTARTLRSASAPTRF